MKQRINMYETGAAAMKAVYGLGKYLSGSALDQSLLNLVYYRVSQINGCAYCLDMHSKHLLAKGETVQRLLVLDAWREAPFYSDRERAALQWAIALTRTGEGVVPDPIYEAARQQFSASELVDLTIAVLTINCYNRINLAFPPVGVGTYHPGQHSG